MKLEELGLASSQIKALEKKKIYTAEALLRRQPLHYYDFRKTYPVDAGSSETMEMVEKNRPFAVSGVCSSFSYGLADKARTIKVRIRDDVSGNDLFVNVIGSNIFLENFLSHCKDSPHRMIISVPSNIPSFYIGEEKSVNKSCLKQIEFVNNNPELAPRDFIELKTGGVDGWSKIGADEIAGDDVQDYIKKFLPYEGHMVNALRWYARGLRLDLAIKKVMLDDDKLLKSLIFEKSFVVGGFITYSEEYQSFSVLNPVFFRYKDDVPDQYFVQYGQTKGIPSDRYKNIVEKAYNETSSFDFVPGEVCNELNMPSFKVSARMMHFPNNYREIKESEKRAEAEDLLYFALKLNERNRNNNDVPGIVMNDYSLLKLYSSSLPFELTGDQKNAVNAVASHMVKGEKTDALIQGDVGTGKTAVAICLLLIAAGSGYQGAIAAPYTALAHQHYKDISKIAENLGVKAVFLASDVKGKQKKQAIQMIESGEAQIVVGTHSIFSKDVIYKNLALVIEDEEHKFGVVHKEAFYEKALPGAHHVIMSATPIPKSIASTIYDDSVEILTIKDKPGGRIPIQTAVCSKDITAMEFMVKEKKSGHQCYVVCPAIESGESDASDVSIESKSEVYRDYFTKQGCSFGVITGKMKPCDREKILDDFSDGKIDVLMATTVIEVGINNPNATVMTILGADRFGFSTLHQLRGRVGRGSNKSYCILVSTGDSEKLQFLCSTNDGFEIAEKDLELRGPGSLFGERQSGDNYFINLMLTYPDLFREIKQKIIKGGICNLQTGREIIRRYEEIFLAEEER